METTKIIEMALTIAKAAASTPAAAPSVTISACDLLKHDNGFVAGVRLIVSPPFDVGSYGTGVLTVDGSGETLDAAAQDLLASLHIAMRRVAARLESGRVRDAEILRVLEVATAGDSQ